MKTIIKLSCILLLASCTKIIDVDFKNGERKHVIECEINNQAPPYSVYISTTAPLSNNLEIEKIDYATVIISDYTGVVDTLIPQNNGTYLTSKIVGKEGVTYTMTVKIHDTTYIAVSTMPTFVKFDSLFLSKSAGFGKNTVNITPVYVDRGDETNYYRFKTLRNDSVIVFNTLFNDALNNGKVNSRPIFMEVEPNDKVTVEMRCLNYDAYKYFFGLEQINPKGRSQSATPADPISNISGGALGFFTANTYESKTIYVK